MVEKKNLPEKVYLFTGENRYALQSEIMRWKKMFQEKYWAESVFSFNGENWDYWVIKQTIFWWWFFITNKIVILYWIPLDIEKSNALKVDQLEKLTDDLMNLVIPSETLVICVSYKPDKRNRFYKWMDWIDKEYKWKIKTFNFLSERELFWFVAKEAEDLDLSNECIDALIKKVWNDQYRLVSEIDKLSCWKKYYNEEIDVKVVEDVCFGMLEDDIFTLLDFILEDRTKAISFLNSLQEKGLERNSVNWSFMWGLRHYMFVLDYDSHWITDSKQIASELKQNPWVIINLMKKISKLRENRKLIKALFDGVINIDYEIKNWQSQPWMYFFIIKEILLKN